MAPGAAESKVRSRNWLWQTRVPRSPLWFHHLPRLWEDFPPGVSNVVHCNAYGADALELAALRILAQRDVPPCHSWSSSYCISGSRISLCGPRWQWNLKSSTDHWYHGGVWSCIPGSCCSHHAPVSTKSNPLTLHSLLSWCCDHSSVWLRSLCTSDWAHLWCLCCLHLDGLILDLLGGILLLHFSNTHTHIYIYMCVCVNDCTCVCIVYFTVRTPNHVRHVVGIILTTVYCGSRSATPRLQQVLPTWLRFDRGAAAEPRGGFAHCQHVLANDGDLADHDGTLEQLVCSRQPDLPLLPTGAGSCWLRGRCSDLHVCGGPGGPCHWVPGPAILVGQWGAAALFNSPVAHGSADPGGARQHVGRHRICLEFVLGGLCPAGLFDHQTLEVMEMLSPSCIQGHFWEHQQLWFRWQQPRGEPWKCLKGLKCVAV